MSWSFIAAALKDPQCISSLVIPLKSQTEEMEGRRFCSSVAFVALGRMLPGGLEMYHLKLKYYSSFCPGAV
jgi:hypothetical protein